MYMYYYDGINTLDFTFKTELSCRSDYRQAFGAGRVELM